MMRVVVAATAACFALTGLSMADEVRAAIRKHIEIPPQPLGAALQALAKSEGFQIVYVSKEVNDLMSVGVSGDLTPEAALSLVLSGTGLVYQYVDEKTVTVFPSSLPKGSQASSSALATPLGEASGSAVAQEGKTGSSGGFRLAQVDQREGQGAASVDKPAGVDMSNPTQVDEVVVTGSRLLGPAGDSAVPVNVYSRERIDQSGASTLPEFLNGLTEVSVQTTSTTQHIGGASPVQLRGLPVGTTLVLIDGRRIEGTGGLTASQGAFFDLNSIPLSAIERIEILPTGSSAIYGGDALGGVVNIVLRKNYQGLEADVRYAATTDAAYNQIQYSLSGGWKADRWNFSGIAVFADNSELQGSERALTSTSNYTPFGGLDYRTAYTNPGNVCSASGANLNGLSSPCAAIPTGSTGVGLTPADFSGGGGMLRKVSMSGPSESLIAPEQRYGVFLQGSYQLLPAVEVFADFLYNNMKQTTYLSPPATSIAVDAANPNNPFGQDVNVQYRFMALGRESFSLESSFLRPLLGIRGTLHDRWHWEAAAWTSRDRESSYDDWYTPLSSVIEGAVSSGSFNPFQDGPGAPSALLRSFYSGVSYRTWSAADSANAFISGPIATLPAGDVQAVVGGEFQRDSLEWDMSYDAAEQFNLSRNSKAAFGELKAPLIGPRDGSNGSDMLSVQLAVRYDQYSDFGSRTSYQGGIEFRPMPSLLIRAAYGTAFKPPQLYDVASPPDRFSGYEVQDPKRGGQSTLIDIVDGGNSKLTAETGYSHNIGIVWTPTLVGEMRLELTHWAVRLNNGFTLPSLQQFLAFEDSIPGHVIRGPVNPGDPYGVGPVTEVDQTPINFGFIDEAGFDASVNWHVQTSVGEFWPSLAATETYRYRFQLSPGFPVQDAVSRSNDNADYAPRWKSIVGLNWKAAGAQLGVIGRYTGPYRDVTDLTSAPRELGNIWYVDLNTSYELGERLLGSIRPLSKAVVSGGIRNVLDRKPVYSDYEYGYFGYDANQYDIQGRLFWIQLGVKL